MEIYIQQNYVITVSQFKYTKEMEEDVKELLKRDTENVIMNKAQKFFFNIAITRYIMKILLKVCILVNSLELSKKCCA